MKKSFLTIFLAVFFISCSSTAPAPNGDTAKQKDIPPSKITIVNLGEQSVNLLPKIDINEQFDASKMLSKRFANFDLKPSKKDAKNAFWALDIYKFKSNKPYYGSNLKPLTKEWFKKHHENANETAFLTLNAIGVTTANTDLRNLPTKEPVFFNPQNAAEGYPFDYLQSSTLSVGFPIFISHLSKDGAWAMVRDDDVWGWVSVNDIKIISKKEANEYQNSNFITILEDKTPVYDENGWFLFHARIGSLLPFSSESDLNFTGQIYTQNGKKTYKIAKEKSAKFPLVMNEKSLKTMISSLLNEPYGWGGISNLRDCSLLTKDLLGSFGLWLPRNSKAQSNIGEKISLENLTNEQKISVIKAKAVPYLTLLHSPGHIMIYVGVKDENVLILHDAWGIKTKDDGRALIGQTAITTLFVGSDVKNVEPSSLLISKIKSINILGQSEILKKIADEPCNDTDAKAKYNALAPLNTPLSDAGRCRDYEFLNKTYGSSQAQVSQNLKDVIWLKDFGAKRLKFNAKNGAADALQKVSDELNELAKKEPEILKFLNDSGTFKWRHIANTNRLSAHSYGIAIDINVSDSSYWQWHKEYKNTLPKEVVYIFEKHKFIWGGRWRHFDTMHFEYRPEIF
ncbi:glycoside hydrolase [Campylobacter mucosalis]|uniref:bifunctional C40 family peptidase/M15 family metallopeptidase n=1 Tax=Campylobacter mucosalis TaxID=202 RepID=UPI0004D3C843|nr:M15 family metallopeptidase [Campylobacter mucosalis]KEA45526.1 glycoside hydrolase [Campylobacter mucosalis]QKF63304.1 putative D-alanyl-D-alanine carboxypeptidase, NlpC/P60 family lipoprotein (SH3b1, SH3b2 type SH3 domains) [Campylobacter mucosalis]